MTDKELLEFAAKAAGYDDATWNSEQKCIETTYLDGFRCWWNPLENDGDALRLAVKLGMSITRHRVFDFIRAGNDEAVAQEADKDDPCAATRRAIVRAAAEIGKERK